MKTLRIGIIGCGAATKRYYVPAFQKHPDLINGLYLVDKNLDAAKEISAELGGGQVFDDYKKIIDNVDGVIIALPHFLHFQVANDFLKSGIHVLCEKPLAESPDHIKQMMETAGKFKSHLCVNNTRRMFPSFRAIASELAANKIGNILSIRYIEGNNFAWPSNTGFYVNPAVSDKGILLDLGPHVLDTICWWLGEKKPEIISCFDDSFGGPESLIHISAKKENCKIAITLNRLIELDNTFEIIGEKGKISGNIFEWNKYFITDKEGSKKEIHVPPLTKEYPDFILPLIDNFIGVLNGSATPVIPAEKTIPSITLMQECYNQRERIPMPWMQDIKSPILPDKSKVMVTGASGFIGCRVVEMLLLSGFKNIRAAIHQWSSAARLGRFPVEIVSMDLMDKDQVETAMKGITHIIHCAKGVDGATDQGTINLLAEALKNKVEHFVHLSTTEVFGNIEGEVFEDAEFEYTGNEYNRTKLNAEKACWDYHEKGLPITVLRPSIVYGPHSANWTVRFASLFFQGKGRLYEKYGQGKCNLVYVDDLVRCILSVLSENRANGKAFNIVGPEIMTWNEYFSTFNKALSLAEMKSIASYQIKFKIMILAPVRTIGQVVKKYFMTPVKKLAVQFDFIDKLLRKTETTLKDTPCNDELKLFARSAVFKNRKTPDFITKNLTTNFSKGIKDTVNWLRTQSEFNP